MAIKVDAANKMILLHCKHIACKKGNFSLSFTSHVLSISVSNGTGQCNFSGQRDRSSFIVPRQRDKGTSLKSCHGTGRDFLQAVPSQDRGVCPGTFAPALVLGQRNTGTRKFLCPGTSRSVETLLSMHF